MKSLIIALCIFIAGAIIAIVFFLIMRRNKSTRLTMNESAELRVGTKAVEGYEMQIQFEDISALTEIEESKLVEVKDSALLAKIDNIIPGSLRIISGSVAQKAFQSEVKSIGTVYRAILPQGEKLVSSRGMTGAFRGFARNNGKISSHANLVPVDVAKSANKLTSLISVNAVMNVASMVVGQYYMSQINNRLDGISSEIDMISDFQQNEFKSKIYALVAETQKISTFQVETLENDELRNRDLDHLKFLEHECAQLLGQANLSLQGITSNNDVDYKKYKELVNDAEIWCGYQKILLEVMYKISDLTYAMNLGAISRKNSTAIFLPYADQSEKTNEKLKAWHDAATERLEINMSESKRTKQGISGVVGQVAGKIKEEWKYEAVEPEIIKRIENQTNTCSFAKPVEEKDLYNEDVQLIVKDGKLYYLPAQS